MTTEGAFCVSGIAPVGAALERVAWWLSRSAMVRPPGLLVQPAGVADLRPAVVATNLITALKRVPEWLQSLGSTQARGSLHFLAVASAVPYRRGRRELRCVSMVITFRHICRNLITFRRGRGCRLPALVEADRGSGGPKATRHVNQSGDRCAAECKGERPWTPSFGHVVPHPAT
jgi:hypothetical protein